MPTWKEGMENLAAEGAVTVAASGSKNPDREADHWQSSAASTKEAEMKRKATFFV